MEERPYNNIEGGRFAPPYVANKILMLNAGCLPLRLAGCLSSPRILTESGSAWSQEGADPACKAEAAVCGPHSQSLSEESRGCQRTTARPLCRSHTRWTLWGSLSRICAVGASEPPLSGDPRPGPAHPPQETPSEHPAQPPHLGVGQKLLPSLLAETINAFMKNTKANIRCQS